MPKTTDLAILGAIMIGGWTGIYGAIALILNLFT